MNRTNVIKKNNPEKKSYKLSEKGLVKKQIRGTIFVLNIESLLGNCVKKEYFFCSRLFLVIIIIIIIIVLKRGLEVNGQKLSSEL